MRVYLNSPEAEHIWSVDEGNTSTETHWDLVSIECQSFTARDLAKRGSKTEPCAWIECPHAELADLSGAKSRIALVRNKLPAPK
jgi:hypothetical protein